MEPQQVPPRRETDDLDHFFTPERLAQIDEAEAAIARGEFYTLEDLDAELARLRAEWIRKHPVRQ